MRLAILAVLLSIFFCGLAAEEALFFVTDAEGDTLFAVYPNGVIIKNEDGERLFTAESDSIRAYVYEDPATRTSRGGFAIGGVGSTTRDVNTYFQVCGDSVRIYLEDETARTSRGGFAIGGVGSTTRTSDYYFNLDRSLMPEVIDPSQPRLLWYPSKEAVRMGRVLVQNPDSVGTNSMATGYESQASGDYSQALGYQSCAIGDYSTAIGYQANAVGDYSFAIGDSAQAIGYDSFAMGFGATTVGNGCFAIGSAPRDSLGNPYPGFGAATAEGMYSFSIGLGTYANSIGSVAMGMISQATHYSAVAIGWETTASGTASTALGRLTHASGNYSAAMGSNTNASGAASTAMGYLNDVNGGYSTVMGQQSIVDGNNSLSAGISNYVSGNNAVCFGAQDSVFADYSLASGYGNTVSGRYAAAIGGDIVLNTDYSFAAGQGHTINAANSFTSGYLNDLTGSFAVAMGAENTVSSIGGVALGAFNEVGYYGSALGYSNYVGGTYSFAAGNDNTAQGQSSVALGYHNWANEYAAAIGYECHADSGSVAMGYGNTALGSYSVALGYYADSDNGGVAVGTDVSANTNGVAMGRNASNDVYSGSFVFGDNDAANTVTSDANNQFRARFRGGVKFHTTSDLAADKSVVITGNEGNLGVGTDNPQERIQIAGNALLQYENPDVTGADGAVLKINNTNPNTYAMSGIMFQNGTYNNSYKGGIFYRDIYSSGRGNMLFCNRNTTSPTNITSNDADLIVYYNGRIGIGTDPDMDVNYKLTVDGRIAPYANDSYDLGHPSYRWQDAYLVNSPNVSSDERLKERITDLRYGLADLMRLRPVSFQWKDDDERETHLGLIAQEVREVIPEAVVQDSPDDYMGMRYTQIIPVLISAVQEQQQQIEKQAAELERLTELADEFDNARRELETSNENIARLESEMDELRNLIQQISLSADNQSTQRQRQRQ
ncbi:MAG: tail fiber domain-containing protein [Candidatus Cloacimonetes bacterium]|nr:tail fiber domain-containing protein [Candidatus Cloacimonadota bacterium]